MTIIIGQSIVFGVMIGAVYSIVAAGFSFFFGTMNFLNVAYGSLLVVGGYVAFFLFTLWHVDPGTSIPIVAVVLFLIGLVLYKGLFSSMVRFHEESKHKNTLLVSFGLLLVLEQLLLILFTVDDRGINPTYTGLSLAIFGLQFPYIRLGGLVIAGLAIFGLQLFLTKTFLGKSIRATAKDWEAATLMGINIDRTYLFSFALGSAIAGIGGVLVITIFSINPGTGLLWTLKAMIVTIVAGVGNIGGIFVIGILLGVTESVSAIFIGPYMEVAGLVLFLLVLMLRPRGFFGTRLSVAK